MRRAEIHRDRVHIPNRYRGDPGILNRLDGRLLTAVDEPSHWPAFLDDLAGSTGAARAHLWTSTGDFTRMEAIATDSRFTEYETDYNAHYGRVCPAQRVLDLLRPGTAISFSRLVSHYHHTEYWSGLHAPHRIDDELGANGHYDFEGKFSAAVCLHNELGRGPFDEDAHLLVAALAPHFATATRITLRLRGGFRSSGIEATVEQLASAAVIVDARARVRAMNARARSLARRGVLRTEDGALQVSVESGASTLFGAIADTLRTASGTGLSPGRALALRTLEGPVELFIAPLRTTDPRTGEEEPLALVVISGNEEPDDISTLSPAQHAVAVRLSHGATIAETAADLRISTETVKTHLKEVYRKLGIASRAELARRFRELR